MENEANGLVNSPWQSAKAVFGPGGCGVVVEADVDPEGKTRWGKSGIDVVYIFVYVSISQVWSGCCGCI